MTLQEQWELFSSHLFPQIPKTHMLYGELRRAFFTGAQCAIGTVCTTHDVATIQQMPIAAEIKAWEKTNTIPDCVTRVHVLYIMIQSVGGKSGRVIRAESGASQENNRAGGPDESKP